MIGNEEVLRARAVSFIRHELKGKTPEGYSTSVFSDSTLDIEGSIYYKGPDAYVVLRSTDSPLNWGLNFLFIKTLFFARRTFAYDNKESKVRLHLGFYLDYVSYVRGYLHAWLQSHPEITDLMITGHSLGGTISTLAAVDIRYNFEKRFPEDRVICMTFGAAAAGNEAFAESYDRRVPATYRYKYRGDPVSDSPPEALGFCQVSSAIQLGKPRKYPWFYLKDHELVNYELGKLWP